MCDELLSANLPPPPAERERERETVGFSFFLPVRFSSERLCTRSLMGLMEAAGPLVTHAAAWLIFSHSHKYKDVKQEQQAYLGSPPGTINPFWLPSSAACTQAQPGPPTLPANCRSRPPLSIYFGSESTPIADCSLITAEELGKLFEGRRALRRRMWQKRKGH